MFKVGDWVECVDIRSDDVDFGLKVGKRYEILEIVYWGGGRLKETGRLKEGIAWHLDDRFKPASFRVGDETFVKRLGYDKSHIRTITKIERTQITTQCKCEAIDFYNEDQLELISEGDMDKYTDLKERIERVEAWDKEADDILQEIVKTNWYYGIVITTTNSPYTSKSVQIVHYNASNELGEKYVQFGFQSQCEKLEAFKKALMWLLEHSSIKNEKKEKIDQIQEQIDKLQGELTELKEK